MSKYTDHEYEMLVMVKDLYKSLMILFIGAFIALSILYFVVAISGTHLSDAAANDVCIELTGNEDSIALSDGHSELRGGKLICEVSDDLMISQNIIIKEQSK